MKQKKKNANTSPVPSSPSLEWILKPPFLLAGLAVWSVVVLYFYFKKMPLSLQEITFFFDQFSRMNVFNPYLQKIGVGVFWAALTTWVSFQLGLWTLRKIIPQNSFFKLEQIVIGTSIGYVFFSFLPFFLGSVHLWYRELFWVVLVGLGVLFAVRRERLQTSSAVPPQWGKGFWDGLSKILLWGLVALYIFGCLAPEIFYDSLYYHIAVPNLYRINHRIYSLPTFLFSNFVLNIQFLYGFALTVGNTLSAKLIHGLSAGLLALSFIAFGQRYLSKGAGVFAALVFLSLPVAYVNGISAGIDVAWCYFQFIAAYVFIRALSEPDPRWLMLAGGLTGFAAGCKYPGFPFIPIAMIVLVWARRRDQKMAWNLIVKDLLFFAIPAGLLILPTLIKNAAFHGNPLYPFGGRHFGTPIIDPKFWKIFVDDANSRYLMREFESVQRAFKFICHPWFITMRDTSNDVSGPLYLILLPLLILAVPKTESLKNIRRYGLLIWALWLATCTTPRYGLPALALLAPFMAEGLFALARQTVWKGILTAILFVGFIVNIQFALYVLYAQEGWRVIGGQVDEDSYLSTPHMMYPTPPYEGIIWMNKNLPKESNIMFVGETRSYYTEHSVIPSSVPDPQPIVTYAKAAKNGQDLANALRHDHVTHFFLNYAEATRVEGYGLFPFDEKTWAVLDDFWSKNVRLIWKTEENTKENFKAQYVFEMLPETEAQAPHAPSLNPFIRWKPKEQKG